MTEKLMAGAITAVLIAPLCAVCILGPAVLVSLLGGWAGWLGGLHPLAVVGIVATMGAGLCAIKRWRSTAAPRDGARSKPSPMASADDAK